MTITTIHFIAQRTEKNEYDGNREMIIFEFDEKKNKSNLFYNTANNPHSITYSACRLF